LRYSEEPDRYCYAGTDVLRNLPGLRDPELLARYEVISVDARSAEPLPPGRFGEAHFKAVHRHLFQDVYGWAGQIRKTRLSKKGSHFCYPENIKSELSKLFGWLRSEHYLRGLEARPFAKKLAHFLSELNAIHAFREGNGRAQMSFVALLAAEAGFVLDLDALDPDAFLRAMIAAFRGSEDLLTDQLFRMF
jgi:cell filamentation protein